MVLPYNREIANAPFISNSFVFIRAYLWLIYPLDCEKFMDTPFAITLEPNSGLVNKTGTWRTQLPRYSSQLPPCNHACPAGENIQQWLYYAVRPKQQLVVVQTLWGARRGRDPKL